MTDPQAQPTVGAAPECYKCGNAMEPRASRLPQGAWFCPKCEHPVAAPTPREDGYELEPCPFCGAGVSSLYLCTNTVSCRKCGGSLIVDLDDSTIDNSDVQFTAEAIRRWNVRASRSSSPAAPPDPTLTVECPQCKTVLMGIPIPRGGSTGWVDAARKALEMAMEWAARFPLSTSHQEADKAASAEVYVACREVLRALPPGPEGQR